MKKVYPSQTPEARRKANEAYREKNRAKLLEYDRARYAERYAARRVKPQSEHQKEHARLKTAKWREQNPQRVKQANRSWRRANPQYERVRKAGVEGSHTASEWGQLLAFFGHRCVYCGAAGKLTKDHVVPLSRKELSPTDNIDNILPACASCNSRKKDKTDGEYRRWIYNKGGLECLRSA